MKYFLFTVTCNWICITSWASEIRVLIDKACGTNNMIWGEPGAARSENIRNPLQIRVVGNNDWPKFMSSLTSIDSVCRPILFLQEASFQTLLMLSALGIKPILSDLVNFRQLILTSTKFCRRKIVLKNCITVKIKPKRVGCLQGR